MIKNGEYYLITTDNWFLAPDGNQYKAAWGKCEIITTEEAFSFKPLRPSTNWFVKCGNIIIGGCQIHYAIECDKKPAIKFGHYESGNKIVEYNNIYIAEE